MQIGISDLAVQLERRLTRVNQLLRANARVRSSVAALLTLRRLEDEGPLRIFLSRDEALVFYE